MNILEEIVTPKYEVDSSPEAYEFYRKVYGSPFLGKYDLDNVHPMKYNENGCYTDELDLGPHAANRLEALLIGSKPIKAVKGINVYSAVERVGGETDFNFKFDRNPNRNKAGTLLEIANYDQEIGERLRNHYSKQHHALVNFSLMIIPGALQIFKSKGLRIDNQSKFEWMDRLDSLIYLLDEFYHGNPPDGLISGPNGGTLKAYLDSFAGINKDDSIKEYCRKVYLIDDADLIGKLIENGCRPLTNKEDVDRYLNLADDFWTAKAKSIDKILK